MTLQKKPNPKLKIRKKRKSAIRNRSIRAATVRERTSPLANARGSATERKSAIRNLQSAIRGVAVFFDRDGVINVSPGPGRFVLSWRNFRFVPGVIAQLQRLKQAGFFLVLVTNQSGVGRGLMSRRALEDIHRRMQAVLGESAFDAIHYCHHHPQAGCVCRKPSPWMILRACAALGLNPRASFLVGDSARDIEMGRAAGCRTIFCGRAAGDCRPDKTVRTVRAAVEWILRNKQREA